MHFTYVLDHKFSLHENVSSVRAEVLAALIVFTALSLAPEKTKNTFLSILRCKKKKGTKKKREGAQIDARY